MWDLRCALHTVATSVDDENFALRALDLELVTSKPLEKAKEQTVGR